MRIFPASVLLAALVPHARRQEESSSIVGEIDALIEKTNALERFRAVYEIVPEDEAREKSTLVLTYVAPDEGGVCSAGNMQIFLAGNRYYLEVEGEDRWKTFELEDCEARRVLEEAFPTEDELVGGISFSLDLREGFQVSVASSPTARAGLLLWLPSMRRASKKVVEVQDQLVWTGNAFRAAISRETGFPEEIRIEKEDKRTVVTLVELELDDEAEDGLGLPEEARSAVPDEAMGEQVQRSVLANYRSAGFLRLESRLNASTVVWDARTRALWEQFLESLHRDLIALTGGKWAMEAREGIDRMCVLLREGLNEQNTSEQRAELRKGVTAFEQKLVEKLDKAREGYPEGLPEIGSSSTGPRDELFAVEREVVERIYVELVSEPTLDYLHEQVEAVLGKE